ncbi:hypothetical protein IFM89_032260, partial [Coptis chinensis]
MLRKERSDEVCSLPQRVHQLQEARVKEMRKQEEYLKQVKKNVVEVVDEPQRDWRRWLCESHDDG